MNNQEKLTTRSSKLKKYTEQIRKQCPEILLDFPQILSFFLSFLLLFFVFLFSLFFFKVKNIYSNRHSTTCVSDKKISPGQQPETRLLFLPRLSHKNMPISQIGAILKIPTTVFQKKLCVLKKCFLVLRQKPSQILP